MDLPENQGKMVKELSSNPKSSVNCPGFVSPRFDPDHSQNTVESPPTSKQWLGSLSKSADQESKGEGIRTPSERGGIEKRKNVFGGGGVVNCMVKSE